MSVSKEIGALENKRLTFKFRVPPHGGIFSGKRKRKQGGTANCWPLSDHQNLMVGQGLF